MKDNSSSSGGSDDSSSISDSSESDCENNQTCGDGKSDYDNLNVISEASVTTTVAINSNKKISQIETENNTEPTLADAENSSLDQKEENDLNDDLLDFNFMDDDDIMNEALDDNWIQEDDLMFGSISGGKQRLSGSSSGFGGVSIHPPRILHRIEEENSQKSTSSESESASEARQKQIEVVEKTQEQVQDKNKMTGKISEVGQFSQLHVKFKYERDESDISSEKLRSKHCEIDDLLVGETENEQQESVGVDKDEDCDKLKDSNQVNTVDNVYEIFDEFVTSAVAVEIADQAKARLISQTDLALTENDASSDFDEADFDEEDEEVQLIEQNDVSDELELDNLALKTVHEAISNALCVNHKDDDAKKILDTVIEGAASTNDSDVDKTNQVVVVEPVVGDFSVVNELNDTQVVAKQNDSVTVDCIDSVVNNDSKKNLSSDLLNESSNDAFEVRYEYMDSEVEDVINKSQTTINVMNKGLLKQAESEIDISNFELRFAQAMEETSPLIKILSDIDQEIDKVN